MGLDMYLRVDKYVSGWSHRPEPAYATILTAAGLTEFATTESPSIQVQVTCAYWRKANAIHNWFVQNVQDGRDECQVAPVSADELHTLLVTAEEALAAYNAKDYEKASQLITPREGFFFGGTEIDEGYQYELMNTIEQLTKILALPEAKMLDYYYQSSW